MNNLKNTFFVSLIALPVVGFSQDTIALSKKDLLQKAASGNLQLKIAAQGFEAAKADYRQTHSIFLPSVTASATAMVTTNPLMAFGSKLNQEILTQSDFNPALLNDPDQTQNFGTKIEVLQPLINMDGLYARQAARSKMQAFELQNQRSAEYLELEVNKAFMQLQLAYRAVNVLEKAHKTGNANLKLVQDYFKQGILQKTDVLNVEVRVNDLANQLQYAKSSVQNASDYLAFLINEDPKGKVFKPDENLTNRIALEVTTPTLSDNRKDLQAVEKSTAAYQKMLQSAKMNFLPRLNAFGSYELYDRNLFGTAAKGYLVGAQLSWSLFDGYQSIGKAGKAKAEFLKSSLETQQYKAQSQLEWNKTNRQLKDAENKVALSQRAFEQSQEAYRIRQNRFAQGLEKTTDLLASEIQMIQKELEQLQAVFEYNHTQQYLQFLTK